jgi:hypothetical protein
VHSPGALTVGQAPGVPSRRCFIAAIAVVAVFAGCGGSSREDRGPSSATKPESRLAATLGAWSSATISYDAVLQQCARQPQPARGYEAACTREWRTNFQREQAKLLGVARGDETRAPVLCRRAATRSRSVAVKTSRAFNQALRADSALLEGRARDPHRVGLQLQRADSFSKRNAKFAARLSQAVRHGCQG